MRRFFVMLLCLLLFCSVCIPVSAHKGKTDGSGGHKDLSTGDYHYHHGYPAHDHYDMDGDGKIDCPYNFDNQTITQSDHIDVTQQKGIISTNESDSAPMHQPKKLSFSDISVMILMIFMIVITVPAAVFFLCIMIPPLNFLVCKIGELFSKSDESPMIVIRLISVLIDIYLIYRIIVWR